MAAINSLGITFAGAESKLNSELIEKLKEADKNAYTKPAEASLEKVKTQREDYKELKTALEALSKSTEFFSSELTYLKRSASATGDGADVYADDGVDPQSGSIHIKTIAKSGVVESKGFATKSTIINNTSDNQLLKLKVDGKEFKIDVIPNMTLEDLRSQIADATDGNIIPSILDTGGDDPYKLILKSKETGADQNIEVIIDDEAKFDLDLKTIQQASDAEFEYNGVTIKRDNNTIDDLFVGIKMELKKDDSDISFKIERDLTSMAKGMQDFVDAYNEAMKITKKLTTYNEEDTSAASFMGDSRLSSIQTNLNQELFQFVNDKTMADYGLDLTKTGDLIFKASTFNEKMQEDPEGMEKFMKGGENITPSTYTSKTIGVEYTAHSTTVDGKQVTTYIEGPMTENINIPKGNIKINDIEIDEFELLTTNTPKQNAMIMINAINAKTDETGVKASLTAGGNQIFLTDSSGDNFTVSSVNNSAEKVGLVSGTYFGKSEEYDGVFTKIESMFDGMLSGSNASLNLLETGLKNEEENITEEIEKTIERLNTKYDLMATQFAMYNSQISSFQASFKSIQMQID
ncbi:MAG: flagellar filament capping protein FliD, partial [Campylobacterales bacterium]|nr:flagellar filament capping protein FliD [Campylobacterales bacterium]